MRVLCAVACHNHETYGESVCSRLRGLSTFQLIGIPFFFKRTIKRIKIAQQKTKKRPMTPNANIIFSFQCTLYTAVAFCKLKKKSQKITKNERMASRRIEKENVTLTHKHTSKLN